MLFSIMSLNMLFSCSRKKNLLGVESWQQGVLMSTPCIQRLRPKRLVVSEYEVPKVKDKGINPKR